MISRNRLQIDAVGNGNLTVLDWGYLYSHYASRLVYPCTGTTNACQWDPIYVAVRIA